MEKRLAAQPDCIFCKIVAGTVPCHRVWEDEHTLAFLDIAPGVTGHTLVIPKTHAADLFSIDPSSLQATALTVQRVAVAARAALGCAGVNIFQSNGAAAFQSVFHLHFHVLPRSVGDNVVLPWSSGTAAASAQLAAQLQSHVAAQREQS